MDMDVDLPEDDIPGAGFDFHDVTTVFTDAAADMEPGNFLFMDGFSLHDAMSAFEIGEPRLDSGLMIEGEGRPAFDPFAPLLPQELCWILDRSFSYEMEWHTGNLLSHTVFTLLYVHRLPDIDLEFVPSPFATKDNPSRPLELITVVLKAAVMGLLKCCDLSWRELSKGGVQDVEDWQGEKCDVSLLEGVPVAHVVSKLEEAASWLLKTTKFPVFWRNALRARILLRKTILQTMHSDIFDDQRSFQQLVATARTHLLTIRAHPSLEPEPDSPAHLAFDPCVARYLKTFVPLRVVPVRTPEETWKAVDSLLDGWQELTLLSTTTSISTWEVVGNLRMWLPDPPQPIPYLRSYTQSIFYDGLLVLNKFSLIWMVDRFFFETLGITYDTIVKTVEQRWIGSEPAPLAKLERTLYMLITPHIRGLWYNPPRRRRHLAKSLVNWQSLYDILTQVARGLDTVGSPRAGVVMQIPNAALLWRLSAVRELVFSGFQLELYAPEERPIAYWYASQVLDAHLSCLDSLLSVVSKESTAYHEMQFQSQLLTALQAMSVAIFVMSMSRITFSWNRMRPSFYRRYKWAFRPEYDDIETPVVSPPELYKLLPACSEASRDEYFSPSGSIETAEVILSGLLQSRLSDGWAGLWAKDRIQLVQNLAEACEALHGLPTSVKKIESFDADRLKWDPQIHPWFPSISAAGK